MRLPVPIATLCARALQTKPSPDRRSRSRVQTKHGGLGLGSTWVWGQRCKVRARSVPGEGIDEKLLWFVSLGFEPVLADVPRVHREESGKQQLHLWSLPGARGEGGGKGEEEGVMWVTAVPGAGPALPLLCRGTGKRDGFGVGWQWPLTLCSAQIHCSGPGSWRCWHQALRKAGAKLGCRTERGMNSNHG